MQILLKGLCRDCLVHFLNNAKRASLFAMELEKLRVNGKITPSCQTNMGSLYVSRKLSTYPFPEPTLTLTSLLGQNVGLGEQYVGRFPETNDDPNYVSQAL